MSKEVIKSDTVPEEGLIASLISTPSVKTHQITYDIAPATIFKILFTVATIWLVIHIFPVIILVVFSLMLVATFNPLVRRMQARMRRSWAIVGVVTLIVLMFLGILALLIPPLISQGMNLFQHAPHYIQQLQKILAQHGIHLNVGQQVERLMAGSENAQPQVVNVLAKVVSGITAFATVAILTIYL